MFINNMSFTYLHPSCLGTSPHDINNFLTP